MGRRRSLPGDPERGAGRRRGGRGRHARAAAALPGALHRGRTEVGRHGDHRAGLRLRLRRHPGHRRARRRQWVLNGEKIFVTSGLMARRKVRRLRGGLGDGGQVGRARRHQGLRRREGHARDDRHASWSTSSASAPPTPRPSSSRTAACPSTTSSAARRCRRRRKASRASWRPSTPPGRPWRPAPSASAAPRWNSCEKTLDKAGITIRYGVAPQEAHRARARLHGHGGEPAGGAAAHLARRWMMDKGLRNSLEASMAKAKAGLAVTKVTQKAVELLGPLGYSRKYLLEKWMRDAQDQRHLRGHAADQHADHRPPHPRLFEQRAELNSRGRSQKPESRRKARLRAALDSVC